MEGNLSKKIRKMIKILTSKTINIASKVNRKNSYLKMSRLHTENKEEINLKEKP